MKEKLLKIANWLDTQDIPMGLEVQESGVAILPAAPEDELFIPYDTMTEEDVIALDTALKLVSKVLEKAEKTMTLCDIDNALEKFQKGNITIVLSDDWDGRKLIIEAVPACETVLDHALTATITIPDVLTQSYFEKNIVPQIKERFAKLEKVLEVLQKRKEEGEGNFAQIQENDDTKQN